VRRRLTRAWLTGFFQGVIRASEAFDEACKDFITREYAGSTHVYHRCPEETLRCSILSTIDLLWATFPPI